MKVKKLLHDEIDKKNRINDYSYIRLSHAFDILIPRELYYDENMKLETCISFDLSKEEIDTTNQEVLFGTAYEEVQSLKNIYEYVLPSRDESLKNEFEYIKKMCDIRLNIWSNKSLFKEYMENDESRNKIKEYAVQLYNIFTEGCSSDSRYTLDEIKEKSRIFDEYVENDLEQFSKLYDKYGKNNKNVFH